MNKVILIGRLVKDVELKYGAGETPLARAKYTLAVNRPFKKEGEQEADFINMVTFGKSAEFAEKYFKKGQQVAIVGRLQTRTYDDDKGNKQYITEIIVDEQHFADSKK
ncbi:MAG: single-stranded DNA-binding protein [Firmicutes bacterium HGW-Firmicutes-7]|nr:MAG: single-stranded DNA-binding protein [Firmicutes bacterium HGW-Firmicutes-7]